jgi:two-component system chemotaxis sensor kinase CheA
MADMDETAGQFEARLRATFEEEARAHVRALTAAIGTLADGASGIRATGDMLATLHTLKGAARAVDLTDLELLCHMMERLCMAWRDGTVAPAPGQLELLREASGAALANVTQPGGGTRNLTMALVRRLLAAAESIE